jgi:hypothetical protein
LATLSLSEIYWPYFEKICTSTYEVCVNLLIWFNIINTGDIISWIFEFFVLCALCCQFHWIVNFWLPLLYYLTSILKICIWSTCTVALSKQATHYFRWSRLPYYNLTVLPKTTPNGEGIPYLPPGNVWAALWFESCDPSPVPSKSSKIILIVNHMSECNFVWTSILLISEN